ncbi:ATP-binding cassette domain-containing protein [Phragmitibacter flavus]|uniref:ATP-binding cassette domain-containing protein n=1 Tax=Phragmitibacter flavus TaxID=2576071 RepID=A0A5R8KAC3_9BACT|nr:polysaccharide ABC transporter ATP-binding protein [Phragmitibacter flavus]TLD69258.1 ATP-binding cassette domain-containing protein [Phragmitibacter flavus]
MSDTVIKVENLSKKYLISHKNGRGSGDGLRHAIQELIGSPFRRLRAGFQQSRATGTSSHGHSQLSQGQEEFWALKDVSFEIKRGEVVGIIGRNGAGKSTLLKILSRITEPTSGRIGIKGRVASLLEVGTGFHPELTGRENIYLNGAILGMSRDEVKRKFDEIVDFSGVEKFLDTPVKRYSSGMYVRLAFAVAAHLEPEILIVDEVLAVGDAEFQKKCLGKMKDVAGHGRTVLFVSHNMAAVNGLTTRAIALSSGTIQSSGKTKDVISDYLAATKQNGVIFTPSGTGKHTTILQVQNTNKHPNKAVEASDQTTIDVNVTFTTDGSPNLSIELFLIDITGQKLAMFSLQLFTGQSLPSRAGTYTLQFTSEPMRLAAGEYTMDIATSITNVAWDHYLSSCIKLEIDSCVMGPTHWNFRNDLGFGQIPLLGDNVRLVEGGLT